MVRGYRGTEISDPKFVAHAISLAGTVLAPDRPDRTTSYRPGRILFSSLSRRDRLSIKEQVQVQPKRRLFPGFD